jgi:ribonuclease HII
VGGDATCLSIAAASIIAKVARDRLMARLAMRFPQYGWETNAGYGTPAHCQAMARVGISPHHRRAFAPVRAILQGGILLPEPMVEAANVAAPSFASVAEAGSIIVLNEAAL